MRDGDSSVYAGKGVEAAVKNVEQVIRPALIESGLKVDTQQKEIDALLKNLDGAKNKSKLGANAIVGVSMACARAGAAHSVYLTTLRLLYQSSKAIVFDPPRTFHCTNTFAGNQEQKGLL